MTNLEDRVAQLAGVAKIRGELFAERWRRPLTMELARQRVADISGPDRELRDRLAELCFQAAADAFANPRPRPGGVSFTV